MIRENPDAAEQMDTEQTWPTEEELEAARPRRRRLPPGTSDYQACWILDDDEDGDDDDADGDSDGQGGAQEAAAAAGGGGGAAGTVVRGGEGMEFGSEGGSDMEVEEEEPLDLKELQRIREERRRREVDDDLQFPDEMDTPHEVPARVRPAAAAVSCRLPRRGCAVPHACRARLCVPRTVAGVQACILLQNPLPSRASRLLSGSTGQGCAFALFCMTAACQHCFRYAPRPR